MRPFRKRSSIVWASRPSLPTIVYGHGILGFASSALPTMAVFMMFAIMWDINGWSQSMGAPPAIMGLSRWYPRVSCMQAVGFHRFVDSRCSWRDSDCVLPAFEEMAHEKTAADKAEYLIENKSISYVSTKIQCHTQVGSMGR